MIDPDPRYLAGDVVVEPLVDRWYAWIQLLTPATAAFHVVDRHLRMMASYVRSPALHAAAAADSATRSGPFLDLGGGHVREVADLLDATQARAAGQIELVDTLRALDRMLGERATGEPLDPWYQCVPEALRGLVELTYDRHHRPDVRVREELMYASPLWDTSRQCVRLDRGRTRPFVMSTPRLAVVDDDDDTAVDVAVPFHAPALDALFRARTEPTDVAALSARLGLAPSSPAADQFAALFTDTPPTPLGPPARAAGPPPRGGGRVTYFGHACLLFEDGDSSVLVDPVIAYDEPGAPPHAGYVDLPPHIDYVLITHAHHDHVVPETLLQIRHRVGTVVVPANDAGNLVDPSLRRAIEHLGFDRVVEVRAFEQIPLNSGVVTAVPFVGEHHDLDIATRAGYHIRMAGRSFLVAADSANVDPPVYARAHALVGDADVVLQGMECVGAPASWVYGPYFSRPLDRDHDATRRGRASNSVEAIDLIERFNADEVYVYAMGAEPWLAHLLGLDGGGASPATAESDHFVAECRRRGLVAERLYGHKELRWP
ncbi:4-amino-L-phenylalanyl-(CmlP-peptidyl-carrier-protein) 3-hydroxylase [Frankia sp. AiPs1]|uniref:MBL fold metallo-hydrolase n=1 Tax=Frankia sp. AiPa1 TaxID=573492 RepID=UPI00202B7F39|nr:MBL fold metallo-hydrolase [Frankia sp. AiPa1]MCL9758141.1 MBL fold metallo-hydrolase [Frankia sp. AiPa1]